MVRVRCNDIMVVVAAFLILNEFGLLLVVLLFSSRWSASGCICCVNYHICYFIVFGIFPTKPPTSTATHACVYSYVYYTITVWPDYQS